jgi:hypothetical protein
MSRESLAATWRGLHHWRKKRLKVVQASDVYKALPLNAQRIVSHCIRRYESPENGIIVAQARIANELGLSRKTVNEHLQRIVAAGIFGSEMRFRHGRWVARPWSAARRPHVNSAAQTTRVYRTTNRYQTCWRWLKTATKTAINRTRSKVPFWADNNPSQRRSDERSEWEAWAKADGFSLPPPPPPGMTMADIESSRNGGGIRIELRKLAGLARAWSRALIARLVYS